MTAIIIVGLIVCGPGVLAVAGVTSQMIVWAIVGAAIGALIGGSGGGFYKPSYWKNGKWKEFDWEKAALGSIIGAIIGAGSQAVAGCFAEYNLWGEMMAPKVFAEIFPILNEGYFWMQVAGLGPLQTAFYGCSIYSGILSMQAGSLVIWANPPKQDGEELK